MGEIHELPTGNAMRCAVGAVESAAVAGNAELVGKLSECIFVMGQPGGGPEGRRSVVKVALGLGWADAAKAFMRAGLDKLPKAAFLEAWPGAIRSGDADCMDLAFQWAAKHRVDPSWKWHAYAAMLAAVEADEPAAVEKLLEMGVEPDPPSAPEIVGEVGATAFFVAAISSRESCARLLAKAGADVDAIAKGGVGRTGGFKGWSPIGLAVKMGRFESFKMLVELGANLRPAGVLPHRDGVYGVENPLVDLADKYAASSGDDRFLVSMRDLGVKLNLSNPVSKEYAALARVDKERDALSRIGMPKKKVRLGAGKRARL